MMFEQFLQRIFRTFRRTFSSAIEYLVPQLSQMKRTESLFYLTNQNRRRFALIFPVR